VATRGTVRLREVEEADLLVFFEHQRDPETIEMAAFPPREREAFMAHWAKILGDDTVTTKTVLFEGEVAGNIVSFERDGEREVGYMLGRDYWGKGIATRALSTFLRQVRIRPLYAHVAKHNVASMRVLEKNGFTLSGEDKEFLPGAEVEGFVFELRST
jgi:RimJ/RimL family protein N-acetyltransferase